MVFNPYRIFYDTVGKKIDFERRLQKLRFILEISDSKQTPGSIISIFLLSIVSLLAISSILSLLFGSFIFLLLVVSSIGILVYPWFRAYSRKEMIDEELSYAFSYLSTLVSVGLNPLEAFKSLIEDNSFNRELRREFELIFIECTFFGKDLLTALLMASKRTPSKKFANVLQSIISSIVAGSELKKVLMDTSLELIEEKRRNFQRRISNLSIFTEIYVILCVFVPVLLVVSFPIVDTLSNFLMVKNTLISGEIIEIFVYLIIPTISVIALILLDMIQPKEVKS